MKQFTLILFIAISACCFAQERNTFAPTHDDSNDLYISGGVHIGLWTVILQNYMDNNGNKSKPAMTDVPFNIQADKLFKKRHVLGIAYSKDCFTANPVSFGSSPFTASRQNVRIRYFKYLSDPGKIVSCYMGTSVGISYWESGGGNNFFEKDLGLAWWPTAQFIFGVKFNINEFIFVQAEVSVGPPCLAQVSAGIKF